MGHRHSHLRRIALAAPLLALALAGEAQAAPPNSCTIIAEGLVAFGPYDWTKPTPTDSVGTITYTCNNGALVFFSGGNSGTSNQRFMTSGANTLTYNLYTDANRTNIWGDFFDGNGAGFATAGNRVPLTVYGRIPPGQNVAVGSYTDIITVTFFF